MLSNSLCAISFGHNVQTETDMIKIDNILIEDIFAKANESDRKRMNYDLRTSSNDGSQRMLNALLPGSIVPIHRHPHSNENVLLLCGKLVEVIYDTDGNETERIHLDPSMGNFGCVVPAGAWHSVEVLEPSVIYEAKDGKYGEDGSETLDEYKAKVAQDPSQSSFSNSIGDLKKNIEYLIGMERQSGNIDTPTPQDIAHILNVSVEEVEQCMKEISL